MTAPIDFAARRSEMAARSTRERRSPEADRAVRELLIFRSRWIEAITFDRGFTDVEKVIGVGVISRYLNRDPDDSRFGMVWMSNARIAGELGLGRGRRSGSNPSQPLPRNAGERTVRRALQKQRAIGFAELIESGGGRHKTATFRPTLPGMARAPHEADTRPLAATNPAAGGQETRPPAATNPKREDPEGGQHTAPLAAASGVRVSPIDVVFEEFWSAFPHRPGDPKRVARAVFGEIVRGGIEPELLIDRAHAHAANIEGLEPRYWMMAHKWLREECWSEQTVHPIRGQAGFDIGDQPGDERAKGAHEVSDAEWRARLTEFAATNRLSRTWLAMFPGRGLPPQNAATRVPAHLREEFGFA
jgi:hypothetical protein